MVRTRFAALIGVLALASAGAAQRRLAGPPSRRP